MRERARLLYGAGHWVLVEVLPIIVDHEGGGPTFMLRWSLAAGWDDADHSRPRARGFDIELLDGSSANHSASKAEGFGTEVLTGRGCWLRIIIGCSAVTLH